MEAAGDGARDRRPTPAEELDQRERVGLVRRALADLPEMYRVVVVLRQYENLKFREIAEVLDLPEGTVKWRMAAALAHLRRALRPIDDEPGHTRDSTDADVENTTDAKDTKDTKSAGPAGDEGGGAAQPAKQGAKKERLLL